jgi:hypothetical protein
LRWRVGVGDLWGTPGQQLAAPPGPAVVTLAVEAVLPGLWLQATTRFQVTIAPTGTTRIALRPAPVLSERGSTVGSRRGGSPSRS